MGSSEDTGKKAFELIGCITPRLLARKTGYREDDLICALRRLGRQAFDWRTRAGCERALQMLKHRVH